MTAAFLWGQMGAAEWITGERIKLWTRYHAAFEALERDGRLRRPVVPADCRGNAHMYYILLPANVGRRGFLDALARRGVNAVSHYVPLHDSPAGVRFGRVHGALSQTSMLSERLVRLPMWLGLEQQQARVIDAVRSVLP
jgi:dTDP-4-amino-4,6-dideoxygalactose transaminase